MHEVTAQKPVEMPVADGLPLLGSALALLANPLQFFRTQRRKHGNVFRVKAGPKSMVVLSGIDANRFMNEEGKELLISRDFWGRLAREWNCPHFLSVLDGEAHIADRKHLKSSMTRTVAMEGHERLVSLVQKTIDRYVAEDKPFSARELTRELTNSELYLLLTGQEPDIDPYIAKSLSEYQRITFNVLMLGKWPRLMFYTPQYLYHKYRSMKFVRELQVRMENDPPEYGFFKLMMELKRMRPAWTVGDYETAFLTPFWAGLDTLGSSLTFLFQEYLQKPELAGLIKAEVDAAVADNDGQIPDPGALSKLPELFGFCMEILRLYPVAFGNPRSAADDFEYDGFRIRKDEQVLVFTTATHFDEEYFPEPERFDTHRYLEKGQHRQRFVFNPFGRGPHICLAAGMAEAMLLTTVATILHHYEIKDANGGREFSMIFDPSPTLPNGFKLQMQRSS